MSTEVEFALCSILAPAAAALAAAWLLRRILPAKAAGHYGLAAALAISFLVGFALLPDVALLPKRHWHWLPYLGLAAILGAIGQREGRWPWQRWLAYLVLAIFAANRLMPTWAALQPWRIVVIPLLATYLFLLMALLAALPERLRSRLFLGLLTLAAVALTAMVIDVSVKLGQVTAIAAATLVGCTVFTFLPRTRLEVKGELEALAIRGLIPVFVLLVGGMAFAGAIEPRPKIYAMLLAPAAPLMLWLFAAGPLARLEGWKAIAAQVAAVAGVLAAALALVVFGERGSDQW